VTADEATNDAEDRETRALLDRVRREIEDEVRARRAAGDFPPSFERKLDELFARFTPTGSADDQFTEALKLADRSAYFDIKAPIGSRRTAKGAARYVLWQAEAWFFNYVVTQLNHFSASVMRVLHLLDERLSELEGQLALAVPPTAGEEVLTPGADVAPFLELLTGRLHGARGRVLHAECGDGTVLRALGAAGIDAYGIDPGTVEADAAAAAGLDVRRDEVLGHLGAVATESLGGLVLSGCIDRMARAERRRLVQAAELALAPGGTIAVVGVAPAAWAAAAGEVAADLAADRPFHAATWAHLLGATGFVAVEVVDGPRAVPVGRVGPDHPDAAVLNAALERLEALAGGPASYAVLATKR